MSCSLLTRNNCDASLNVEQITSRRHDGDDICPHRRNSRGAWGGQLSPLVGLPMRPWVPFGHGSGQPVGQIRSYSGELV
jgi:hypothetical protein